MSRQSPSRSIGTIMFLAAVALLAMQVRAEDWPRWRGARGDGTWQGPALAEKLPAEGLATVWRQPIGGGYSGITVADGRVYTMDRQDEPKQVERIHCFDAATGKPLWTHTYDAHYGNLSYGSGPRASVTIHEGRAYTLGAVGHVHCLDAATGKVIWSVDTVQELGARRPEWGFAASPVIYQDTVIVHVGAKPAGCLVALNRQTGKVVWRGGEDSAGYATPILIRHADQNVLIAWTPESVLSLDPDDGRVHWSFPYPIRYGVSIHTPIYQEGLVLVSSYWHGARALKLGERVDQFSVTWSVERELNGLMSQPLYRDGHAYMLDKDLGVTCFELSTGRKLWDDGHKLTPHDHHPQVTLVWTGHDNRMLALNSEGVLIHGRFSPRQYEELWRANIIGKTWAHPAYAGKHVYARSDTELKCVALPVMGQSK